MSGDFELLGLDSILDNLEAKLGYDRMKKVVNKTLREVAKEAGPDLQRKAESFQDTGATVRQVVVGNVSWKNYNIPTIKIGWGRSPAGESPRWNLEHLQELGYTKDGQFIRPRGFGKIQELVDEYGELYPAMAQETLKELLK